MPELAKSGVSRCTLAKGAARSVPAVAAAAPAYAVSDAPPYALQGWLRINRSCDGDSNTLRYDSAPGSENGSDGDPFGLYIKNALPEGTASGASLTLTLIGGSNYSVTTLPQNQNWTVTRSGNTITAAYTGGWTWRPEMGSDQGAGSLWADGRLAFQVTARRGCRSQVTSTLRRCVTFDPDGPSYPRTAEQVCFNRTVQI